MKKFILIPIVVLTSTLLFALPNTPPTFEAYDANKDGVISEVEFDDFKAQQMTLKADEGKQLRNAGNSPMFSDFDKNGDGKITKEELRLGQEAQKQKQMEKRQGQGQGKGNKSMM